MRLKAIILSIFFAVIIFFIFLKFPPELKYLIKPRKAILDIVKSFQFSADNSLKEWEEKVLKGKVLYRIEKLDSAESYVRATSEKAASALYYKLKIDIRKNPVISWKWRVNEFPKKNLPEGLQSKKEEDFAARVYIIFPAVFFTNSKAIEYVWAETLAEGTNGPSAYSSNIRIMVLRSGKKEGVEWVDEERDVVRDYEMLFGERPRLNIGAVAFMTDADSTKTSADAVYDEINIGYRKGDGAK